MKVVILDANVLVPYIVGCASRDDLTRHGNTLSFNLHDFDNLCQIIGTFEKQITIPHVLAEASNLLDWGRDPMRRRVMSTFKDFIAAQHEEFKSSSAGVNSDVFFRLGLTDALLCEAAAIGATLITMDGPLHRAALGRSLSSIHFVEIIENS
jgi:hypothetical protein